MFLLSHSFYLFFAPQIKIRIVLAQFRMVESLGIGGKGTAFFVRCEKVGRWKRVRNDLNKWDLKTKDGMVCMQEC